MHFPAEDGQTDPDQLSRETAPGPWHRFRHFLKNVWSLHSVRYLAVGFSAFLVDVGMIWAFTEGLKWPVWWASGAAFLLSFAYTYSAQRIFAFGSRLPHNTAILRYTVVVAFNTLATMAIVTFSEYVGLAWLVGKVMSTALTTLWNFFLYKYWVFPPQR